jgi:hypothetical protein
MHIQITKTFTTNSGKVYQAGEQVHCPASVAEGFIFDGVAERVKYKSYVERLRQEEADRQASIVAPVATVEWSVAQGIVNSRYYISAKCSRPQCSTLIYDAPPTAALEQMQFLHSCGCVFGEVIPAAVAAHYRKLFKPVTQYTSDEARAAFDARPQPSVPVDPSTYLYSSDGPYRLTGPLRPGSEQEGLKNYQPNPGDNQPLDPKFYKWK